MAHRKVPTRGTTKGTKDKPAKKESTVDYLARLERYVGEHESLARSKKAVAKKKATAGIKGYGKGQPAVGMTGGPSKIQAKMAEADKSVATQKKIKAAPSKSKDTRSPAELARERRGGLHPSARRRR